MKHNAGISSEFIEDKYWGSCSCGWQGETRTTEAEAFKDVADHLSPIPRFKAHKDDYDEAGQNER